MEIEKEIDFSFLMWLGFIELGQSDYRLRPLYTI